MRSLVNALSVSSRAAARVGPTAGIPAASSASAIPWPRGASGPIAARSAPWSFAQGTMRSTAFTSPRRISLEARRIPGFWFAIAARISAPLRRRASTIACSRPPPPTTRTFTYAGMARRDKGFRPRNSLAVLNDDVPLPILRSSAAREGRSRAGRFLYPTSTIPHATRLRRGCAGAPAADAGDARAEPEDGGGAGRRRGRPRGHRPRRLVRDPGSRGPNGRDGRRRSRWCDGAPGADRPGGSGHPHEQHDERSVVHGRPPDRRLHEHPLPGPHGPVRRDDRDDVDGPHLGGPHRGSDGLMVLPHDGQPDGLH